MPMALSGSSDIKILLRVAEGGDHAVQSHHQNSEEAGVSKDISGDEGLSSGGTKLNSVFIIAEVTFTKPK
ncbi:hypothetical protein Tco_1112812 [Tanacetum coccineum]|uniref:Uncharacterized protein n=1 Tax=Tanacetum coccineum TaxID=301880 RepID=A0ABQ5IU28_9ASTR